MPDDIFYPVHLFDSFREFSGVEHGAILVLDEADLMFVPAAFTGFDNTTRRRLRIPREIIDQHGSLQAGESLMLSHDERTFLESFFSIREYGLYSKMALTPIRHEGIIYAVLLLAADNGAIPLPVIPQNYGDLLYECYSSKLKNLAPSPYFSDRRQAAAALRPILAHHRETGHSIHLCTVNVHNLLENLMPASQSIDVFRFRDLVLRVLYALASPSGIYFENEDGEVFVGAAGSAIGDCDFLCRHLLLSLSDFFGQDSLPESVITGRRSLKPGEIPDTADPLIS